MESGTENVRKIYTDVFLSHNWGKNSINHKRVSVINQKLVELGYKTWFDEEQLWGSIDKKMAEGIEQTECVIVFLTRAYHERLTARMKEITVEKNFYMHQKEGKKD